MDGRYETPPNGKKRSVGWEKFSGFEGLILARERGCRKKTLIIK